MTDTRLRPLVFIHGLLMSGWVFMRMQHYFSKLGYQNYRFNYPTRSNSIQHHAHELKRWLDRNDITHADFICHSMGGLVCHAYFSDYAAAAKASSKVVCLGSPFKGSMVARSLSQSRSGRMLLGAQSNAQLSIGVQTWPGNSTLGVIAGNRHLGAGLVLGVDSSQPGDGTILVDETFIQGAADHIILPVSHSQMTFSMSVFRQTEYFLNHCKFNSELL